MTAAGTWTYTVNNANTTVNALNAGGTLTDTFVVTTVDGTPKTVTVTIAGANDAAVNAVPGTQSTNINTTKVFSAANGNAITISDVDNTSHTVTLTATSGTITLATTAGLAFTIGDGTADGTMTFSGTDAAINAALNGLSFIPTSGFAGAASLQITTTDSGALSDTDTTTINVNSLSGTALTTAIDTIFFSSGTNSVTGTAGGPNPTANNGDTLTGGTGIDTLTISGGSLGTLTFGNGTGSIGLTNFENLVLVDSNNGNHIDNVVFNSTFNNGGTLTVDGSGIGGNGKLNFDSSATSNSFIITGGNSDDTITLGSGTNVVSGGNGDDRITAGSGTDTITGGSGADTVVVGSGKSAAQVGGSGDSGTLSGHDTVTDFAPGTDFLDLQGTPVSATATAGTDGTDSTLTIAGQTVKSHAIANGIITFDDANTFSSALSLTSISQVAAVVQYLQSNDIGNAGATVAFTATIGGVAHTYIYEQVGATQSATNDILVDLVNVTLTSGGTSLSTLIANGHVLPAGVAGEPINLGLTNPAADGQPVMVSISQLPAGWSLAGGILQADGSWTIQTLDASALSIVTPSDFAGAVQVAIVLSWTQADGSTASLAVSDNVEVFAPGSPIFAWSGDDTLTGSSGADTFVFSQPIGADVVHNFDTAADTIDLIGYGFTSFANVLANMADDASGYAVITLANGQTITLAGVSAAALTAANFVFDVTPTMSNAGTTTIGNGALRPMSGTINNSGTISLGAQGATTVFELIQNGITLQGGGNLTLSDSAYNVVSGSLPSVTFNNVDNVISGAGQLGAGSLILTNGGTIIANGINALVIDTGANSVINSGTIEATGVGGLEIVGSIVNSGLIWAAGGNIVIGGDLTGTGDVQISGTATVEIGGIDSNDVVVGSGAAGLLVLDDATNFTGTISGLNADDRVDLRDIAFGANTTMSYADNGAGGGVLTVSDGVNSVNLALVGAYQLGDFSLASDGQGGSLLTNNAGATTDYGSGVVDVTPFLSVAAGVDVIADGYVRVTTTGLVQVDADGGGNGWVSLGRVDLGAAQYTVQYLSGGVATTLSVNPVAPPIALDLNGDGVISFISTDAGATFDYGGGLVATAWVGPQDGILVRDANHDGQVTANEIVFATSGSDLQGLAVYDSNHDGQLTSADANFGEFAVWQDANSNGKVDAGELQSLTARGITGISLSSDGVPYSAAGGDVSVVGTGSFTRVDGSTSLLADAVFATGPRPAQDELRATSAANTNVALIGAVAAAGLMSAPLAAEVHVERGAPHGPDLAAAHNSVAGSIVAQLQGHEANFANLLQQTFASDHLAKFASHGESKEALPSSSEHSLIQHETAAQRAPAELLAATATPAQPEPSSVMASGVMMPSIEQLQALDHSAAPALDAHQSNEVVSKVLVDALHGGGDGPDLDALINTLGGHNPGSNPALHALAGHTEALVPGMAMNVFGDFMMHPFAFHGEGVALHPDAPHVA